MFTCFGANESCWRSNNKTTSGKEMVLTGDGHRPLLSLYPSWFYLLLVAWVTVYIPLRLLSESSSRMATSIQEDLQCLSDRHQGTRGELGNLAAGPVSGPLCSRDRMTSSRLFKRMFLTKQSESDSMRVTSGICAHSQAPCSSTGILLGKPELAGSPLASRSLHRWCCRQNNICHSISRLFHACHVLSMNLLSSVKRAGRQ